MAEKQESEYYEEGGALFVRPYIFEHACRVKGRWFGRSLEDVLSTDFRSYTYEYWKKAALAGLLTLNEANVDLETILKTGDVIRHVIHRHERCVLAQYPYTLGCSSEYIAVYKPPSWPVHTVGKFRKNTLVHYLKEQDPDYATLLACHRIDRLVSGIVVLSQTAEGVAKYQDLSQSNQIQKEYLARVDGEFPEGETVVDVGILPVSEGLNKNKHMFRCDPQGKPSRTTFRRINVNRRDMTSLVACRPHTGRPHQIRVHLSYLGHPIANDPVYGPLSISHSEESGDEGMKDTDSGRSVLPKEGDCAVDMEQVSMSDLFVSAHEEDRKSSRSVHTREGKVIDYVYGCKDCETGSLKSATGHQFEMWLHAHHYSCEYFDFKTEPPSWATDAHNTNTS